MLGDDPRGACVGPEYDALLPVLDALFDVVDHLFVDDWCRPTRCEPWTVAELVAHIAGTFPWAGSWLTNDAPGPAVLDRSSMWRALPRRRRGTRDGMAAAIIDSARTRSDGRSNSEITDDLRASIDGFLATASTVEPDDLAHCPMFGDGFVLPVREVMANRVLEAGVHLLDLQHAVGRNEALPTGAHVVVRSILDGLLGSAPPDGLAWDGTAYALKGTGRLPLSRHERATLGSHADLFPLLT